MTATRWRRNHPEWVRGGGMTGAPQRPRVMDVSGRPVYWSSQQELGHFLGAAGGVLV